MKFAKRQCRHIQKLPCLPGGERLVKVVGCAGTAATSSNQLVKATEV